MRRTRKSVLGEGLSRSSDAVATALHACSVCATKIGFAHQLVLHLLFANPMELVQFVFHGLVRSDGTRSNDESIVQRYKLYLDIRITINEFQKILP